MDEKVLLEISAKLDILIALTFRNLVQDRAFDAKKKRNVGVGERARYLYNLGLDANTIAKILESPVNSVRTLLTPKRRA